MRRLLMLVPIAALAVSGAPTADAVEDPTDDTPIVVVCEGTGGYETTDSGTEWVFEPSERPGPSVPLENPDLCASFSVATANVPPRDPPPGPDEIQQDPFSVTGYVLIDGLQALPTGAQTSGNLRGTGDFECGNGDLSGEVQQPVSFATDHNKVRWTHGIFGGHHWGLDWSASFTDGHAELNGTAYPSLFRPESGPPRTLSGSLDIDYGGPLGDECDDSAGAAQVTATFILE